MSDKFFPTQTLLYVSIRHIFISLTSFTGIPNSMRILYKMGGACSSYGAGEVRIQGFGGKPEGRRPLGRPRLRWEDNIKMVLQEVVCRGMD
jgi:hypothetical protein